MSKKKIKKNIKTGDIEEKLNKYIFKKKQQIEEIFKDETKDSKDELV